MTDETKKPDPIVEVEQFGKLPDGTVVLHYTLKNGLGGELEVLEYGGTVRRFTVPGPDGQPRNVIVGPDTLEGWVKEPYYGQLIGRVANRIAHGKFSLDGKDYTLATNNAPGGIPCALHGGEEGFNARVWKLRAFFKENIPAEAEWVKAEAAAGTLGEDDACLLLKLDSPDGDQGYPGALHAEVLYILTPENTWRIVYHLTAEAPTPVAMTQHAYWNLKGCAQGDILDHTLQLSAARYTPVNAGLIPTGELAPVAGTPLDFTAPRALGQEIDADNDQLRFGAGYDHNFVLDHPEGVLAHAATLTAPDGMKMEVWTDQPGIQIYTGNYIPDGLQTPEGPTVRRGGVALETQHFADSVNRPEFPSIILRPGQVLRSVTEYRFPKA
ncbi:MAG: galactose mutarotase [Lentisphaeraceae bacterium]|nr:galactose mutarotase [Lentisphaeraceae bacterium]